MYQVGILQYETYFYVLILCNYMLLVFHLTIRVIHQNFCQELLLLLLLHINIKTLYIIKNSHFVLQEALVVLLTRARTQTA